MNRNSLHPRYDSNVYKNVLLELKEALLKFRLSASMLVHVVLSCDFKEQL